MGIKTENQVKNKTLSSKDLYNLGLAYRFFINDVEKISEVLLGMYSEGVLQKSGLHIKRYLMKAGIMDVDTIEAITRELENGNYKVLDKKSFSMIVETVKNVLIENIKSTIPDELMSNPVFKRGFDGEK